MATILIIDDRAVNRQYLVTLLGLSGHQMLQAADGMEGLALALAERPQLIITDLSMPNVDGAEFVRRLRVDPLFHRTPVILYSASIDTNVARSLASSDDAIKLLSKPAEPQTILDTVNAALHVQQSARPATPVVYDEQDNHKQRNTVTERLIIHLSALEEINRQVMETRQDESPRTNDNRPGPEQVVRSLTAQTTVSLRLSVLIEFGLELASQRDPLYLFDIFCRAAHAILGARCAAVGVLDVDGKGLAHLFSRGMDDETRTLIANCNPRSGIFEKALSEGLAQRSHVLDGDAKAIGLPAAHPRIHSILVVPIALPTRTHGWLYLTDKLGTEAFDADDERLAMTLTTQVAQAQENLILYQELLHRSASLEQEVAERKEANLALGRSEARLNGIIDSATDAIITIDETERIILANPAAAKLFQINIENLVGSPLSDLLPERYRDAHHADIQRFGATGVTTRRMAGHLSVAGRRANGEEFPIQASISQLTENGRKLYTVILRDISEQQRAQQALQESHEQLRELSTALQSVREEERRHLARELHDDIGQLLTALKMDLVVLRTALPAAQSALIARTQSMERIIDQAVVSMRRIATALRPKVLDELGLVPALQGLSTEFSENSGILCHLEADESIELGDPIATALFRMTQEALTNVVRHAQATQTTVKLTSDPQGFLLTVSDNGKGMSAEDRHKPKHYGLLGIRERAHALGGEVRIHSTLGAGATVEIFIPVRP